MANMMKLLKKAANVQKDMEKVQAELADKTVEFTSGGGMVTVVATCDGQVKSIDIKPEAIDPEDSELLSDMVLAGVNGALKAGKDLAAEEMGKLTAGLGLPGFPAM